MKILVKKYFFTIGIGALVLIIILRWVRWVDGMGYKEIEVDVPPESLEPRKLLLSPVKCGARQFIMVVHIRVDDFNTRDKWRSKIGIYKNTYNFSLYFALGYPRNNSIYSKLQKEHETNDDLILADFIDAYTNNTLKHLSHLRYFYDHCKSTKILVKIDDDIAVNIRLLSNLVTTILIKSPGPWCKFDVDYGPRIWCNLRTNEFVPRSIREKWAVPRSRYPDDYYPPYCQGMAYITTNEAVGKLIRAAQKERFFWLDDVFMTGILAQKGNANAVFGGAISTGRNLYRQKFASQKLVFALSRSEFTFDYVNEIS